MKFNTETTLRGWPSLESSVGIEVNEGDMSKIIARGTVIPTKQTQTYTTSTDNQMGGVIQVYEGTTISL